MPGTSGLELGERIKNTTGIDKTVLMLMSSPAENIDTARVRKLGFAGRVNKPVRQSQLFDAIMQVMDTHAAAPLVNTVGAPRLKDPRAGGGPKTARVLLAEDNKINQVVAREMLIRAGYQCDVVTDGKQAFDAAVTGHFDLILMDCQMPG